jgi:hypothetical protein
MKNRLFFQLLGVLLLFASPPVLWGQTASLVKDISPQPATEERSSMPLELFAFHDKVLFSATEP